MKIHESARRLKIFRQGLDLNKAELAKNLEMSESEYTDIESGEKPISIDLLRKLIVIYDINANWIIVGDQPMIL
jgi:transcriptional regulator with XRE-family HTH domain